MFSLVLGLVWTEKHGSEGNLMSVHQAWQHSCFLQEPHLNNSLSGEQADSSVPRFLLWPGQSLNDCKHQPMCVNVWRNIPRAEIFSHCQTGKNSQITRSSKINLQKTRKVTSESFGLMTLKKYPGPRGFLSPRRDETRERKKQREKTSGSGWCESHYHARIAVNQYLLAQ